MAKTKGKIEIVDYTTGETLFTYPFAVEFFHWARLALEGAENENGVADDGDALAYLTCYMIAEQAGHKIVKLPKLKDVTPLDIMSASIRYHVDFDDVEEELSDVVENPSGTKPVSA